MGKVCTKEKLKKNSLPSDFGNILKELISFHINLSNFQGHDLSKVK